MWRVLITIVLLADAALAYPTDGAENMPPTPTQEMGGLVRPRWMHYLAMGSTKPFFQTPELACEDLRQRYGNGNYEKAKSVTARDNNSNLAFDCTFPAKKKGEQDWISQGQVTGEWVCPDLATIENAPDKKYRKLNCQCPSNMWAQGNRCVSPDVASDPCAIFPVPDYLADKPLSKRPIDTTRCPMSALTCQFEDYLKGGPGSFGAQLPADRAIAPAKFNHATLAFSWGHLKDGTEIKLITTNDKQLWGSIKKLIEDGHIKNVGYGEHNKSAGIRLMDEPPVKSTRPEKPNNEHAEDAAFRFWEAQRDPPKRKYTLIGTCRKGCPNCSAEYVKQKYKDMRFERLDPIYGY